MNDFQYPSDFRPVSGWGRQRFDANVKALELLADLGNDPRALTPQEQTVLSRWSGWGACASAFEDQYQRARVAALLDTDGMEAARQSTINAHYTPLWLAQAMWALIDRHVPDGSVLEPGCGHGVFIGTSSDPGRIVGVEKEPATAKIASLLYPSATILSAALEHTPLTDAGFVAAIGNVPFADVKPYDREYNPGRRMSLHNYAIWRALNAVQPGGVIALLTSRYTMDSHSSFAREQFASLANLVTAVRFPSGAFSEMAGTQAIIDLLVFHRTGTPETDPAWLHASEQPVVGGEVQQGWQTRTLRPGTVTLNSWWQQHPELVLGVAGVDRGLYADNEYVVAQDGRDLPLEGTALLAAVSIDMSEPVTAPERVSIETNDAAEGRFPGTILVDGDRFIQVVNPATGEIEEHDPGRDAAELRSLCGLRDQVSLVLDVQTDQARWGSAVAVLNDLYDTHVARFGALNRSTLSERIDKSGEAVVTRRVPKMGGFRDDPLWPLVAALENYDDSTQTAAKAAIFTQRVMVERPLPDVADDPVSGLAACLAESARVDVDRIAELCGMPATDVLAVLAGDGHIFHDPMLGRWVTRAEYLSGDVRSKLAAARQAALTAF